jgi:hypothetical protein
VRSIMIKWGRPPGESVLPGKMLVNTRWLRIALPPGGLFASWGAALHAARQSLGARLGSRH